jgi:hypothetical protein
MRALALLALTGCRTVLGIEDVEPFPSPPPGDTSNSAEAGIDGKPLGCRADYAAIPGAGPRNHRYLFVTINGPWTQQRDTCAMNDGFLAFPDGTTIGNAQMELQAIVTLGGTNVWLGISDLTVEGEYRTSLGMLASPETLALFTATGGGNSDCLTGNSPTSINDESCGNSHKALCECVP